MNVVAVNAERAFTVSLIGEVDANRRRPPEQLLLHEAMKGDRVVRLPDGRGVGLVVEAIVFPYEGKLCTDVCQTFTKGSVFVGVVWRDAAMADLAREARLLVGTWPESGDAGFLLTAES